MRYNLTEKLNFDDNPKIIIEKNGEEIALEVDASATTALKLMDIITNESEVKGALMCADLLIKDKEKLDSLNLSLQNYIAVVRCAMSLAMGTNPDEDDLSGE